MPEETKHQCLAVYLYYNEPWENFLTEAVLPYVKTALKTGIVDHYFFVRYWEKGPHIRLRFFGQNQSLREILRPNLAEHFQTYFDFKPSFRPENNFADHAADLEWLPNNSCHFVAYEPEVGRFGGAAGLAIAEQQFYFSSQVVLDSIVEKRNWDYEAALGTAIKLHLSFVHSLGMKGQEARSFFHFYFHNWFPRSINYHDSVEGLQQAKRQMVDNLEAFEKSFAQQKDGLVAFHRQLWEALNEEQEFTESYLNRWIERSKITGDALTNAQQQGQITPRPLHFRYSFWPESMATTPEEQERWMHFADYLHLTNNRLGIFNKDEAYLAYLMLKSMEVLGY